MEGMKYFSNIIKLKGEHFRNKEFPLLCKNIKYEYYLKGDTIFM